MQIVFLRTSDHESAWAMAAWDAVAAFPGERRCLDAPDDVESLSLWRVGCVVGILDGAEPERLTEFIRAVRTRDGGPDVPIVVCGAFESANHGLQWAHTHGADDFLSSTEPADRLLRRVGTFTGVSSAPPLEDQTELHRKAIRSLRAEAEQRRAAESAGGSADEPLPTEPIVPSVAVVTKNVIALPRAGFVAATRPNGFGGAAHASAPAPAAALAPAPAPATASAPAPSVPRFNPTAPPPNERITWLRSRLVEIRESDYFTILRVSRDASDDEVRTAFDAAIRECAEAEQALGEALAGPLAEVRAGLDEAYEVLADAALRSTYRAGLES